jgi:hypothetical protein
MKRQTNEQKSTRSSTKREQTFRNSWYTDTIYVHTSRPGLQGIKFAIINSAAATREGPRVQYFKVDEEKSFEIKLVMSPAFLSLISQFKVGRKALTGYKLKWKSVLESSTEMSWKH